MFQLDGQPSGCPSFVDCKLSFCVALVNSELRVDAQRLSSRGITALPPDVGRGSAVPSAREKVSGSALGAALLSGSSATHERGAQPPIQ